MASVHKIASWLSGSLTVGVIAGLAALPFQVVVTELPAAEDGGPRAIRIATPPRPQKAIRKEPVRVADATTTRTDASVTVAAVAPGGDVDHPPESTSASADVYGPPVPAPWSDSEIRAALQECLEILAPLGTDIDVVPASREGVCGTPAALLVRAVGNPRVELQPPATLNCKMTAALHAWVSKTLQPAAKDTFGQPVTHLVGTSAYSCRTRYGLPGEKLSEHAFANAIDIAGFRLAGGRSIDVLSSWGPTERDIAKAKVEAEKAKAQAEAKKGRDDKSEAEVKSDEPFGPPKPADLEPRRNRRQDASFAQNRMALGAGTESERKGPGDQAFVRKLHAGACGTFTTVLGPEANEAHRNHFHFDLAERRRGGAYCQ